ncbi:MAG: YicC/YloC family endoribonuclease, partial [Hyphomicrobiales bacterium]
MIKSMTGFASAAASAGSLTVSAEIRTYNSRSLDLALRLPAGYNDLEERVRLLIAGRLTRGRVEARVQVEEASDAAVSVEVDMARARAVLAALDRLKTELGLAGTATLELLMGTGGILKAVQPKADLDAVWVVLERCLAQAMDGLDEMRATEGRHLSLDLVARLNTLEAALEQIVGQTSGLLALYQERLKERIAALTQGLVAIDPARIAQEAALLADRSDISEEIVRAGSHLRQFRSLMDAPEASGRKLNFLLQELNREFNT